MDAARLTIAEEIVDLRTTSDRFQGQDYPLTTGRVMLHAVDAAERVACGRAFDGLLAVDQPWDPAYLPHLTRCDRCATASGDPSDSGQDRPGYLPPELAVTGVDVRAQHGTERELARAGALPGRLS
jgi:hypothetical protein